MTVAEFVMKYLEQTGVNHMFTVVGGGCIFLSKALDDSNIKPVYCINEQGATIAAEAYGQLKSFGAALVTTGPGVTNALTGVAGAYLESTPMLIISGQVNTSHSRDNNHGVRQYGFQELDTKSLVESVTKKYIKLTPADIRGGYLRDLLNDLMYTMIHRRPGPVWLDIPLDVQNMEISEEIGETEEIWTKPYNYLKLDEDTEFRSPLDDNYDNFFLIDNLISDIKKAKRPVVLVGNGVRLSNCEGFLKQLVDILHIPVLCTWKTFDMFTENDTLYMGRPGIVASRYANKIQQECDLFISMGARLDLGQTAFNPDKIATNAKKFIVDVDKLEIDKNLKIPNAKFIHSDVEHVIYMLLRYFLGRGKDSLPYYPDWLVYCNQLKERHSLRNEHNKSGVFDYYKVLPHIEKHLDENTILVHGSSGTCSEATCQAIELHKPTRVIGTHGLGSMGFGLPAAIGAWFATNKKIICVEGDGSFAMNMQELSLLQKYKPDIHIIILNNDGYASIRNTQDKLFDGQYFGSSSNDVTLPDYRLMAKAYNIGHQSIYYEGDLDRLGLISGSNGRSPNIYEIHLNHKNTVTYPRTHTKLVDGKMTTMPMEEMWP